MGIEMLFNARNSWMLGGFLIYVCMIYIYAKVYFSLYKSSTNNFAFGTDILRTQRSVVRAEAEAVVNRLKPAIEIMKEWLEGEGTHTIKRVESPFLLNHEIAIGLKSGSMVSVFSHHYDMKGAAKGYYAYEIAIFNNDGTLAYEHKFESDELLWGWGMRGGTKDEGREIGITASSYMLELNDRVLSQIAKLDGETPDVWRFIDFIYFSTITQSTVGYGDIQPNSSLVRTVVVWQILTGYLILVVLINLALG